MTVSSKKTGRGGDALTYYVKKCLAAEGKAMSAEDLRRFRDKLDEAISKHGGTWHDPTGAFAGLVKHGERIKLYSDDDPLAEHRSDMDALCRGFHPVTGEPLVQNAGNENGGRQTGIDLTFSPPKDFSILWAFAPDEATRTKLEQMLMRANGRALDELNERAVYCRVGKGGARHMKASAATSQFLDLTARPTDAKGNLLPEKLQHVLLNEVYSAQEIGALVDMGLHVHNVVSNTARRSDGEFGAFDGQVMLSYKGDFAETAHAALAHELYLAGYPVKNNMEGVGFTIDGVDDLLKQCFSRRGQQVTQNAKDLGVYEAGDKAIANKLMQAAKTEGRFAHIETDMQPLDRQWVERLDLYGYKLEVLHEIHKDAAANSLSIPTQVVEQLDQQKFERYLDLMLEHESVIREPAYRAFCKGMATAAGHTVDEINVMVDKVLRDYAVQLNKSSDVVAIPVISTKERCGIENEMVRIACHAKRKHRFSREAIESGIKRTFDAKAAEGKIMSESQMGAIRYALGGEDAVVCLEGRAGAGKTFTLEGVREVLQHEGFAIHALSLGWSAAMTLKDEGKFDHAAALEGFVRKCKSGEIKLNSKSAVVMDEASLTGSVHMYYVLKFIEESGALAILTGDTRQISSVAGGGAMRVIVKKKAELNHGIGSYVLDEVRRQKQAWDREAALKVSIGNAGQALRDFQCMGREDWSSKPVTGGSISEVTDELLKAHMDAYLAQKGAGMAASLPAFTSHDSSLATEFNEAFRQQLKASGHLKDGIIVTVPGDMGKTREIELSVSDYIWTTEAIELTKPVTVSINTRLQIESIEGGRVVFCLRDVDGKTPDRRFALPMDEFGALPCERLKRGDVRLTEDVTMAEITDIEANTRFQMESIDDEKASLRLYNDKGELTDKRIEIDRSEFKTLPVGHAYSVLAWNGQDSGRISIESSREDALNALFAKFIDDRMDGTGKSQLMLAKNNENVIALNDMAHAELLKRGLVGPDEVEIEIINRSQAKETKLFSVGDLISFGEKSEDIAKLVGDESEIGAVYNRTKGAILKIEGAGDDASVTVQLWEGDNPTNQTVTVSSKDFRTGAIPMTHSWANSCHSGQGATFSRVYVLPCGLDRAQGYVAFSRHREDLWIFGDKDSLHAHAAKHYEATQFVTRNKFNSAMSVDVLGAMIEKENIKVTTLDYTDDQLRKEMMSFRKNPMNEAAQLKRRMDQLAEKSVELLLQQAEIEQAKPEIKAGFQKAVAARQHEARHPTIQFGDIKVPVPKKASALEIQQILLDAVKAGHRDIQLSGNNRFRSAIFDIRAVSGIDIRFVDSRSQTLIKEMKHAARNQPQSGSGRLRTSGARHRTAPRAPALHAANLSSLASHGKNSLDTQARRNRMLDLSNVQVEQGQSNKSTGSKRRI